LSQILPILEGLEGEEDESYCNKGFGKPLKKTLKTSSSKSRKILSRDEKYAYKSAKK